MYIKMKKIFSSALLALCALAASAVQRGDFQIRDPFVVPEGGIYYLYESKPWSGGDGVFVRTSRDLETWTEKKRVLSIPAGVKCTAVWAPEVHKYNGKYYLFVTITEEDGVRDVKPMADGVDIRRLHPRGTWIFSSYTPDGEFRPVSNGPVTPKDWVCLDGTLVVENGKPYIVFCHEWVQTKIGRMCYAELKEDFSGLASEPVVMFAAADAMPGAGRVTDGPFFFRSDKGGALHMIWSNIVEGKGYCVLSRTSASGRLAGPWTKDMVLFGRDGGHGMIFKTFEGKLKLTLHQPNKTPHERMKLFDIEDDGETLRLNRSSMPASPGRRETVLTHGWTADGEAVTVPHTWNAEDGADGPNGLKYRHHHNSVGAPGIARKCVTYSRSLPDIAPGRRLFVKCGGAAVNATVAVNGEIVGRHKGSVTGFCFELTKWMRPNGPNMLDIVVDNYYDFDDLPNAADYTVFGGLYREVRLIETDPVCIDPTVYGGPGVAISADAKSGRVKIKTLVSGADDAVVEHEISGTGIRADGDTLTVPSPKLWSPETPNLYTLRTTVRQGTWVDMVETQFGFRTAEFRADGHFYLNGKKRQIRAVNYHQDKKGKGWALSREDEREAVALIKEMGADGVRTAHYPHSDNLYAECDRQGLLAWCELPATDFVSPIEAYRENYLRCLREMQAQLGNHPSIVMWSLYNELHVDRKDEPFTLKLLRDARGILRGLDPKRPMVAATCRIDQMALNRVPDALGINIYPGWSRGESSGHAAEIKRHIAASGRKAVAVSEYGAGASVYHHTNPVKRPRTSARFHPEEYQTRHHIAAYRQMKGNPGVWGTFAWMMFDTAADNRTEGDHDGINDKGLVCRDHKTRKDAFWFYKANWSSDQVLHLCGSRMVRADAMRVDITGFSNVGDVALYVNGEKIGVARPDSVKVVEWKGVHLKNGCNVIELRAGEFRASATWLAPEKPEEALVRVKDRKIVDESREIRSRPFRLEWKSHANRAIEAGAEYVETSAVLGDAFDIPLHDFGVKMIFNCTNLVDVQAAVELGAKYIRTSDPDGVVKSLEALEAQYKRPVHRSEFRIRDPYVFADPETKTYYLYETKSPYFDVPFARGVNVRTSKDLETWSPLKEVMSVPTNLRCRTVWAPELHKYKGKYYLFTTLSFHPSPDDDIKVMTDDPNWKPKDNLGLVRRGTWVYKSDSPLGPFVPVADGSLTPRKWMAIDGSLVVDQGKPYMVFCHEWPQTKWGRIDIAEMSPDLSRFIGEPKVLFESRAAGPGAGHVTDGCFCYRSPKTGKLYMIWSPFYNKNYTVFSCESASGRAEGPWINQRPIFEKNGGHGMLFRTFEGQLKLVIHQPERRGYERIAFFDVDDTNDGLVVHQPK